MSKVNVFVSSTCYDLSQIRNDIKQCILDLGHNPILSELKDFPIDTRLTSSENCINAIKNEADIFILIIGNKYGSVLKSGKSITNTEFLAAVNKGIPIYTFALKQMTTILPLWEKNPDADFSNVVDNNKVFDFLADVRKKRGLWNFEFEKAQDIVEILKAQFSNLFHDALIAKRKIESSEISCVYEKISSKAIDILIKKDAAYEIRFFMQSMKDEIEKFTDLQNDYCFSMAYNSLYSIGNMQQFKQWASHKVRELQNITNSIDRLNYAVNKIIVNSTEPFEIDTLYYLSRTYARIYASLLKWGIEVNSTIAPERYIKVMHSFASIPYKMITQIESYPVESLKKIEEWMSNNDKSKTINDVINTFVFDLAIDKEALNMFYNECNNAFMKK
jgi:hypothetical protein